MMFRELLQDNVSLTILHGRQIKILISKYYDIHSKKHFVLVLKTVVIIFN